MKKQKILALITTLVLLAAPFNVTAFNNTPMSTDNQNFVKTAVENDIVKKSISQKDIKSFKTKLGSASNSEKNDKLLKLLDLSDNNISGFGGQDEVDKMLKNADNIDVEYKYIKTDSEGSTTVIDKDEYESGIKAKSMKANGDYPDGTNDGKNVEYEDDYMEIVTLAVYVHPGDDGQKGWYNFTSEFIWQTVPCYTENDGCSLYVDDSVVSWNQDKSTARSALYYQAEDGLTGKRTSYTTWKNGYDDNVTVTSQGISAVWDLPDAYAYSIPYISISIFGSARVQDFNSSRQFDVWSKYEHTYPIVTYGVSFGWTTGSTPGITVSCWPGTGHQEYCSHCTPEYIPDRDIYK